MGVMGVDESFECVSKVTKVSAKYQVGAYHCKCGGGIYEKRCKQLREGICHAEGCAVASITNLYDSANRENCQPFGLMGDGGFSTG